jgi:hypothetical protein
MLSSWRCFWRFIFLSSFLCKDLGVPISLISDRVVVTVVGLGVGLGVVVVVTVGVVHPA